MGVKDVLSDPMGLLFAPITIPVVVIGGLAIMGALDLATSPIQITIYHVNKVREERRTILFNKTDTFGTSNASAELPNNSTFLVFNSMSETEFIDSIEKLASVSEEHHDSLVSYYNAMSEDEISALTEYLYSLSEEEIVRLLRTLLFMSDKDIDSIINSLRYPAVTEFAVTPKRRAS